MRVSTRRMSLESFTTLALPRDLGTPAQGRRLLESALDSLPESVLADAQLLLTEVLSNAILHGSAGAGARLDVSVEADESIVRVTVTDRSPLFPRPAMPMFQTPVRSEMSSPALTISSGAMWISVSVIP